MTARRLLLSTDAVGGVWTYSVELARALQDLGVETLFAVMGPPPTPEQRRGAGGFRIIDTGLPLDWTAEDPSDIHRAGCALADLAAREAADVVQLHSASLAADVEFGLPVVAVQHSCVATWWASVRAGALPADFRWRRDLAESGLNAADAVVAPTAAFAAETVRTYDLGRAVHAVHNGRTPIALKRRSSSDLVFTLGRLWDEGKNLRTLDQAAALLDVPFEAIGPLSGPNGASVEFRHLRTPGPLPADSIADRLGGRPIFASAALYEPFGLSALEAAHAGCALVLSDIRTLRELWDGAAVFVPARDSVAFAEAISRLLKDPELRQRLGRSAQLKALQYSPAAMARRMAGIYDQVLPQAAHTGSFLQTAGAA